MGLNSQTRQAQIFGDDPQGNRLYNWGTFAAAGYSEWRSFARAYTLGGAVQWERYDERVNGGSIYTYADYGYDLRGLPSTVRISVDNYNTWGPTIYETRNIAGLVTKRRADYPASPTPPMTFIESAWTYDVLGRVLTQTVNKGSPATTQVAKQTLTYYGNDDINTLRTDLGATTGQTQTFGFDFQHQLKTVAAGTGFGATYTYGTAGRFTQANVTRTTARPNNDIVPRNVFYKYSTTDPELVTSLNSGSTNGPAFMTYTYDLAGNQLTKVEASTGNKWEYLYDGSDRLRRATKKSATNVVLGSEEYWYDYAGNRSQLVTRNGSGAITEMIWFHEGTEAHYTPPGGGGFSTVTFAYAHAPMVRVKRTDIFSTTTEYQFHGLASNLLAGVESTGTVNVSFNYAPFGEVIEATQSGTMLAQHKRRLNDKQQDDLTGLSYYGARYYDRTFMGWTQVDPLYLRVPDLAKQSTPRRSNLGVFTLNNPVRYLDPDGRDAYRDQPPGARGWDMCSGNQSGQCTMESGGIDENSPSGFSAKEADEFQASLNQQQGQLEAQQQMDNTFCAECAIAALVTGYFVNRLVGMFNDLDDSANRGKNANAQSGGGLGEPPGRIGGGSPATAVGKARGAAMVRGKENINYYSSLNEARSAGRASAGLGADAVDFVQEIGPLKGRVTGRMSPDGLRGWRIDFDPNKGFHVNWWDKSAGVKRSDWLYGANIIVGGTQADFYSLLEHFPLK